MNRRTFLKSAAVASTLAALAPPVMSAPWSREPLFKISLAEWSLNRTLRAGKITNLDFPAVARREFGIDAIEFVDQFFADKAKDAAYLAELKKRATNEGVKCHLLMVDTNGPLGAADKSKRDLAVQKSIEWLDAAQALGCTIMRVNAYGDGNADELRDRVAESCTRLADHAAQAKMSVVIENHGKLSSDPDWLVSLMKAVNKPNFGTLPDFGNFPDEINRYDAVEAMMPYAIAVSAKAQRFGVGTIEDTDFWRMMRIVRDGGYHGYVGVESAPEKGEEEYEAIRHTANILRWIRDEQAQCLPIFNGKDMTGWTRIEGGDWTIENGVLVGRNGVKWTTNPEQTGSWLSTRKEYKNFRLELQFTVNKNGNSGIFFRARRQKNPAFTGYEMQIHDSPGRPPSKTGVGSLYDLVGPTKNVLRPAGEWNSVTIIAAGPKIRIEMNGVPILQTEQTRSMDGYIGLQNHDDKSEVRFKNIRLQELT